MKLRHKIKKFATATMHVAAFLCALFCLNGTIQVCFCADDPDGCGEHCHDCSEEDSHECDHLSVQIDAPLTPHANTIAPEGIAVFANKPAPLTAPIIHITFTLPHNSNAPPDSGGRYISTSTRLFPRS